MAHVIEQRIRGLRRRVGRLMVMYGLCRLTAVVVAAGLLAGGVDYLVRFEDRGIRIMASLALLGAGAWAYRRYLSGPLKARLNDVSVALRVERRFPELRDRLASAVQFLAQPENAPGAGSPALRRAVIVETTAAIENLDLNDALEPRPVRRAALMAAGVMLCLGALFAIDLGGSLASGRPLLTPIAAARLANPLGDVRWPQMNYLAVRDPVDRVALGAPLEIEIVDARGARLPDDARIHYRYPGDAAPTAESSDPLRRVDDVLLARIDQVDRPFAYRVTGGDDQSMPWREVQVIEPPAVERLAVELIFPAYTGRPNALVDPQIRALEGAQVRLTASTTKPLAAAVVCLEDGARLPAELAEDGYGFHLGDETGSPLVVEKSQSYWFELEDREGFHGGDTVRHEMRAIEDEAPSVAIEQPSANLFLLAEAVVPLKILAKDDLALQRVDLHYLRADRSDEGEFALPLWEGPATAAASNATDASAEQGGSRLVEHRWDLAPLELEAGAQIAFHASANDYKPQPGFSRPLRLTIITPPQLQDRIAERQSFILGELARVLQIERQSRSQVNDLEIQLQDVGRLSKTDVDHLQAAELNQRQATRSLISPTEGVGAVIAGLLADLANNRLELPDVERRMRALQAEINRLGDEHLPIIERELTTAVKSAQLDLEASDDTAAGDDQRQAVARAIDSAARGQDLVIASLEDILGDMSEWDRYRRFYRDIAQLERDHEQTARETAEVGRDTLAQRIDDLTAQQRADLKKAAAAQLELANRFDQVAQRMRQAIADFTESDPLAADAVRDALALAERRATGGTLRQAARAVEQNQIGQASERQRQAADDLEQLMDVLANRREHELGRLVKKLRAAQAALDRLREEQAGLRKKIAQAEQQPDEAQRRRELERLARQQRQLQDEAEQFARQLMRLQAENASRGARQAAGAMGQAGQQSEQGDAAAAGQSAEAAERDLDEAAEQLAQRLRQAESDLAHEQLAKLQDGLASLAARQQRVLDDTVRLAELAEQHGRLTRGQFSSLRELARVEQSLAAETSALADQLSGAEVFTLAIDDAAQKMQTAARRLEEQKTDEATQTAERQALTRFQQLLEALKPEQGHEQADPAQGDEGSSSASQAEGDALHALAELKMLKLMQDEINQRTRELDASYGRDRDLTPAEQQEYADLGARQGRLAELLLNLSRPTAPAPEDDPEALPPLGLDDADPLDLPLVPVGVQP